MGAAQLCRTSIRWISFGVNCVGFGRKASQLLLARNRIASSLSSFSSCYASRSRRKRPDIAIKKMNEIEAVPIGKVIVMTEKVKQKNSLSGKCEMSTNATTATNDQQKIIVGCNAVSNSSTEEEQFLISYSLRFRFSVPFHADRLVIMNRKADDLCASTLTRIHSKLNSFLLGKKLKKQPRLSVESEALDNQDNASCISLSAEFASDDYCFKTLSSLEESNSVKMSDFIHSNNPALIINGKRLDFVLDPPAVSSFKFALAILSDFPVMPTVDLKNTTLSNCRMDWFVQSTESALNQVKLSHKDGNYSLQGFTLAKTNSLFYIPSKEDVGRHIAIVISLGEDSISRTLISSQPVKQLDVNDMIWNERRLLCSNHPASDSYRIGSYNVLADLYLDLKIVDQNDLWFPYCPKEFQDAAYRYPLILREISDYNSDVLCLQEVDHRLYLRYLLHYADSIGMSCAFKMKGGQVNEGLCILYRKYKFSMLGSHDASLADLLDAPENKDLKNLLKQSDELLHLASTRPTVVQVVSLKCKDSANILVVGNTHLVYKPHLSQLRLIQIALCIRQVESVVKHWQSIAQYSHCRVNEVLCGDLNSRPQSGVCELLSNGVLAEDHDDWSHNTSDQSLFTGIKLSGPKLQSACGYPMYTNYTHLFSGCLDYVWINPTKMTVEKFYPMPNHQLVTEHTGLPSRICPSDHLPVICDVKLGLS